jgi:uncharacterized protein YjbI with pentapeptide repeats
MSNLCNVEALFMRWLKRDRLTIGLALTGMVLLLALVAWLPVSAVGAFEGASGSATSGTVMVQATPTEDATVTALNKEKLAQEIQQLKAQNEPDLLGWFRTNASILLSTLIVVIGGLIGLFRWFGDRRDERVKRAEERFQSAVTGLGDDKEGAKIGAAILLRTFLRPGYEEFYTQTFDLAVANLRLPRTAHTPEDPDGLSHPPDNPDVPQALTTLSQALIVVFKEAYPQARKRLKEQEPQFYRRSLDATKSLDATGVQLDKAYLGEADLHRVWMPEASLRKANLALANLSKADLIKVDLRGAILIGANLREANLSEADLRGATLISAQLDKAYLKKADLRDVDLGDADLGSAYLGEADLRGARLEFTIIRGAILNGANLSGTLFLRGADLSGIQLIKANLRDADLRGANLSKADLGLANLHGAMLGNANLSKAKLSLAELDEADLTKTDLSEADLDQAKLTGANLEDASLLYTDLRGVRGLTKKQLEACKAKGAIVDDDPMAGMLEGKSDVIP